MFVDHAPLLDIWVFSEPQIMHTPFGSSCHLEWQVILLPIQKQLASCSSKLLIYLIVVIYLCLLYWFSAMFVSVKGKRHLGSLLMNFGMPSTWWIQLFILILESKWTSWDACPFRFLVGWPLQELCFNGTGKWNELSSVLFSCFNTGSNGSQIMRILALAPLFFNGHLSIFLRVSEPNNQAGFKWFHVNWFQTMLFSHFFCIYSTCIFYNEWLGWNYLPWNLFKCAAQHIQFS